MTTHHFALIVEGPDLQAEEVEGVEVVRLASTLR